MTNKRQLPWRNTTNPYHIWLSEVILQQTRVNQGLPYFERFVELFPTVHDLAKADEKQVLRAWQGLGYYSRARNLHKCAKIVAHNYGGVFPKSYEKLIELPGIGKYTAAAIASICFKQSVAVVDGNVFRVLARIFEITEDIGSPKGHKAFQQKANELIDPKHPDIFNQAMMEFGALHCTPKNPNCDNCVFFDTCLARINNSQSQLPVKLKKVKVRKRYFNYLVFQYEGKLALKVRQGGDIWQGLFDFYLIETDNENEFEEFMQNEEVKKLGKNVVVEHESKAYKHILTHQHIFAKFYRLKINPTKTALQEFPDNYQFYDHDEILHLPKPVLISAYLNDSDF